MKAKNFLIFNLWFWSLLFAFWFLFAPSAANATVPVFCPEPCETWDRALSGPRNVSVGPFTVPGTSGIVSAQEGWFVCKEKECISSILSDPIGTVVAAAKSAFSEDSIAWFLARQVLHIFTQEMVSWIRTGQLGGGPLFTTDLVGELFGAADNAAGHFLAQYQSEEWYQLLCSPFRPHIYLALGRGRLPYIERARCTVTDIVDNLENFYTDFSNGGWAAWFATIEPQNNPYGFYLLSLEEKERREREVTFDIRHNFLAGQGFIGLKKCAEGHMLGPLHQQNPTPGKDYCTKYVTVTPGKVVEDQLIDALGSDIKKLGVADELNEIMVAVFDELLSWLVSGGSSGSGLLESDLPDLEPLEPLCSTDTGRQNGCGCDAATQCLSQFCSQDFVCTDVPAPGEEQEGGEAAPPKEFVIISTSPLPDAPLGLSTWSYQFLAEGGTPFSPEASTFPYQWSAVDTGTHPLPVGLFLSQGGALSGTPAAAGTWTFTVKVTDAASEDIQSTFILTVTP